MFEATISSSFHQHSKKPRHGHEGLRAGQEDTCGLLHGHITSILFPTSSKVNIWFTPYWPKEDPLVMSHGNELFWISPTWWLGFFVDSRGDLGSSLLGNKTGVSGQGTKQTGADQQLWPPCGVPWAFPEVTMGLWVYSLVQKHPEEITLIPSPRSGQPLPLPSNLDRAH